MSEIIKVEGLVKRYKELIAVDNFSMKVEEGEILGLLGPNGSGKSTTINCILSLLSNKEIAQKLFLGEGTVRNMISSVLSKLDLRDRTQLACFYYQRIKA